MLLKDTWLVYVKAIQHVVYNHIVIIDVIEKQMHITHKLAIPLDIADKEVEEKVRWDIILYNVDDIWFDQTIYVMKIAVLTTN